VTVPRPEQRPVTTVESGLSSGVKQCSLGVANSNRFTGRGPQWLSVVSIQDALAAARPWWGRSAPGTSRDSSRWPDGRTLYVTNFGSSQLETIRVAGLVSAAKPGAARR
jgi:hypothetical protein